MAACSATLPLLTGTSDCWIGAGTSEEMFYPGIRQFHQALDQLGIHNVFRLDGSRVVDMSA